MSDLESGKKIEEWLHSCIRCGTCKYQFLEYGPSCPSGEHFGFESYFASGRIWLARGIKTSQIEWDESLLDPVFACTTCGSCEVQCHAPHQEHIVELIEDLRALAVENFGAVEAHVKFRKAIEERYNPYNEVHHNRELVQIHDLPEHADTVLFVGCTSNYRENQIRDAAISVLKKAGVEFTIADERCCGSPLLRTGQRELVKDLAEHNAKAIQEVGASRLVTTCAGCYKTLSSDYQKMKHDLGVDVLHITHLLEELLRTGALAIDHSSNLGGVAYHDPCHLGRHMGEYESPRHILSKLPVTYLEMKDKERENAWCCGAGGGAKAAYGDWAIETGRKRIQQVEEVGANMLVSTCPFCSRNLRDASDSSDVQVVDLIELVDRVTWH
jgi:Fe-S oxidoreductase